MHRDLILEPYESNMSDQTTTRNRGGEEGEPWLLVVVAFFCNFIVGSIFFGFSLFYIEFVEYFQCDKSQAGWIGSVYFACLHVSGLVTSVFVKDFGPKPVSIIGGFTCAVGFICSKLVTTFQLLYLTYGVFVGIGCGMVWFSSLVVVQQSFTKRRSLAAGISLSGFTIGAIVMTPLQIICLETYGWQGTVLLAGAVSFNCSAIGILYGRPQSKRVVEKHMGSLEIHPKYSLGEQTDSIQSDEPNKENRLVKFFRDLIDVSLFKDTKFVLFCVGSFCMNVGMLAFAQHNPSRAVHVGVEKRKVSYLPLVNATSDAVSKVLSGLLGNVKGVDRVLQYAVMILLGGILETLFVFATTFEHFVVYTVIFGVLTGGFYSIQQTVQVDLFGSDKIARSQALLSLFEATAGLLATPFAGYLVDITQNYDIPFYVTGSVQTAGGIVLCALALLNREQGKYS